MVNKASISLVPSEMCGHTRGRKISKLAINCCCLGLFSSACHAPSCKKAHGRFGFQFKARSCVLLRDSKYLSTTEVEKVHEFVKFAYCWL